VARYGSTNISVLLSKGDGSFEAPVTYAPGSYASTVAVGDFNDDGKPDLAVAYYYFANVSVLLGNGDGSFQAPVMFGAGTGSFFVAVGDFNGDDKPDLVVANIYSGNVSLFLNTCGSSGVAAALRMVRSNTTATLSWPFPSTGFSLESAASLSATNWQPSVEVPTTNNGFWEVTVAVDLGERYFRLRKP